MRHLLPRASSPRLFVLLSRFYFFFLLFISIFLFDLSIRKFKQIDYYIMLII